MIDQRNPRRTVVAAIEHQYGEQPWVTGEMWHRRRLRWPWPLEVLLDTGVGGSSYMSGFLWLSTNLDSASAGALRAAPMRIVGSVVVPILFINDDRVRDEMVRVVEDLPYGFIQGAEILQEKQQQS